MSLISILFAALKSCAIISIRSSYHNYHFFAILIIINNKLPWNQEVK